MNNDINKLQRRKKGKTKTLISIGVDLIIGHNEKHIKIFFYNNRTIGHTKKITSTSRNKAVWTTPI